MKKILIILSLLTISGICLSQGGAFIGAKLFISADKQDTIWINQTGGTIATDSVKFPDGTVLSTATGGGTVSVTDSVHRYNADSSIVDRTELGDTSAAIRSDLPTYGTEGQVPSVNSTGDGFDYSDDVTGVDITIDNGGATIETGEEEGSSYARMTASGDGESAAVLVRSDAVTMTHSNDLNVVASILLDNGEVSMRIENDPELDISDGYVSVNNILAVDSITPLNNTSIDLGDSITFGGSTLGLSDVIRANTVLQAFNPAAITLNNKETYFEEYTQTGALVISNPTNNKGHGTIYFVYVIGSGDSLTFGNLYDDSINDLLGDTTESGVIYQVEFRWNGYRYDGGISISTITPNPLITSATVTNDRWDSLVVAFDKDVTITNLTGLSLTFDHGTAKTLSSIMGGSGTDTLSFLLSDSLEWDDTLTFNVAAGNNITGDNGRTVAAINEPVVNNIKSSMVLTINTALGDASDAFELPLKSSYTYAFNIDWGDNSNDDITTYNQTDLDHTYSTGGVYTITINGVMPGVYFNNTGDKDKLMSIDQWGAVGLATNQENAYYGCSNLTIIADDVDEFNLITTGANTFFNAGLLDLPTTLTLPNLTNGTQMFRGNEIASSSLVLTSLTDGYFMLYDNNITSVSSSMELPNLLDGEGMLAFNDITSVSSTISLANLTDGTNFLIGNTLTTSSYSTLLVNMENNNIETGVTFHGGSSQYNTTGQTARNSLTSRSPVWVITDGGLE